MASIAIHLDSSSSPPAAKRTKRLTERSINRPKPNLHNCQPNFETQSCNNSTPEEFKWGRGNYVYLDFDDTLLPGTLFGDYTQNNQDPRNLYEEQIKDLANKKRKEYKGKLETITRFLNHKAATYYILSANWQRLLDLIIPILYPHLNCDTIIGLKKSNLLPQQEKYNYIEYSTGKIYFVDNNPSEIQKMRAQRKDVISLKVDDWKVDNVGGLYKIALAAGFADGDAVVAEGETKCTTPDKTPKKSTDLFTTPKKSTDPFKTPYRLRL
jgi:hypothetical protein